MIRAISKPLTVFALIFISLCSCEKQSRNSEGKETLLVSIDCTDIKQGDVNDFIDDWKYVVLQSSNGEDEGLVSSISSIAVDDSTIVINCPNRAEILVYNSDGSLHKTFNRQGQGPKEYISPDRIQLHDGLIYILDSNSKKICVYDRNGSFVETKKLPGRYADFRICGSGLLALESSGCGAPGAGDLTVYDPVKGEIMSEFMSIEAGKGALWLTGSDSQLIDDRTGNPRYAKMFDQTVYELVAPDSLKAIIRYDFKTGKNLTDEEKQLCNGELYQLTANKPYFRWLGPLCETDNCFYQLFDYWTDGYGMLKYIYKFDKQTGQGEMLAPGMDILDQFPMLGNDNCRLIDGWIVTIKYPYSIGYLENKLGRKIITDKDQINEDSNPVLIFHHLKGA